MYNFNKHGGDFLLQGAYLQQIKSNKQRKEVETNRVCCPVHLSRRLTGEVTGCKCAADGGGLFQAASTSLTDGWRDAVEVKLRPGESVVLPQP